MTVPVDAALPGAWPIPSAVGYRLLLPPGWRRVSVQHAGASLETLLDEIFAAVPRDRPPLGRWRLRESLQRQLDTARQHGGLDVFLPITLLRGQTIAASFVTSVTPDFGDEGDQPEVTAALVARLLDDAVAAGQQASVVTVGDSPGVRSYHFEKPVPEADDGVGTEGMATFGTRRVDYTVRLPSRPAWMVFAFSTAALRPPDAPDPLSLNAGAGDAPSTNPEELALDDVLIELFDAMISTVSFAGDAA